MSLTGKEVAQMHKDYVMQSWARSGADTLPVERAEGIYFYDYDGKKYPHPEVVRYKYSKLPVAFSVGAKCRRLYFLKTPSLATRYLHEHLILLLKN